MVKEPAMRFSPWVPWEERGQVKNAHLPGVYLLAHWGSGAPPQVDARSQEVIYIGETTDQSLLGRWQQFQRAAFEGKPGHVGGLAYRDSFGDEGGTLYVSAFIPEGLSRDLRTIFIRYTERRLLWEWAQLRGEAPICNARQL